jgi:molecular chaperone GrpE
MIDENNIQSDASECGTQECCKQDQQQLELQLNQCGQQVAEWKDKYLRLTADLDNVNRRAAKDRALSLQNAQVALLRPILSIVDDFERALESKQGDSASDTKGWDGISMIYTSLTTYLHSVGVEPMKSYDQFDPELHEALVQVDNSGKEAGAIVAVLQKGYLFKGEVLRHAKVSVAK